MDRPGRETEIRIPKGEIERWRSIETAEAAILSKCKKAGIPVKGVLIFRGVERGVLTTFNDLMNDDFVIQWRDGEQKIERSIEN